MLIAMAVWDTEENGRAWMTEKTMMSLKHTVDWERHRLFIVDNGSCRWTRKRLDWLVANGLLPFTLLRNKENLGTAAAINRAWRYRNPGEHAVKMDNDVVIQQAGWADWIEDVFSRDSKIGICGLKRKDLAESPWAEREEYRSTVRMLPHRDGERWLVVERVRHVIGTCQGYSSQLLDKIGYLVQPSLYGFDDSLAAVRAKVAGFQSVFLCGFEIDHLDPGGTEYTEWELAQSRKHFAAVNSDVVMYEAGLKDVYHGL